MKKNYKVSRPVEDIVLGQEQVVYWTDRLISQLSDFQLQVLYHMLDGKKQTQIAADYECSRQFVSNTVKEIRRKALIIGLRQWSPHSEQKSRRIKI